MLLHPFRRWLQRAAFAAGFLFLLGFSPAMYDAHAQTTPTAAPAKKAEIEPIKPVSLADFDPATFAADSGVAAVVLSDYGRTSFVQEGSGFQVRFERTRRVKILREAGLDEATIKLQLYHRDNGYENLVSLSGAAWNVEGGKLQRTETKNSAGTTVRLSDYVNERRLTLAGARVGSVVEIGYVTQSDFIFTLPTWQFEIEDIPVRRSELLVEIPQLFDYAVELLSYYPFALEEQSLKPYQAMSVNGQQIKATHLHWVMRDVPAFRTERFITTPNDYMAHAQFQLRAASMPGSGYRAYTTTWDKASGELLLHSRFGGILGAVGELAKPLRALRESEPDQAVRAQAVVELVRGAIAWNGVSSIYAAGQLAEALRQHKGNSADINLLLVSSLRTAGINADPVILSTRDHGAVPDMLPLLDRFNFVLAAVQLPGQPEPLLLDATTPLAPPGMLPERCLGTRGRLIARYESSQRWLPIAATQKYTSFLSGTVTPDGRGGTTATLRLALTGYAAQRARRRAAELTPEQMVSRYYTPAPGAQLTQRTVTQPTDATQPVTLEIGVSEPAEPGAALPALVLVNLKSYGGLTENPFNAPERRFSVDLGSPIVETIMLEVAVPAGYAIESVPAALNTRTPDGHVRAQYLCTPAPDGRSVQVSSTLSLARASFAPEEYDALRTVYGRLVAKHAEMLVLKKADQ